MDQLQHLSPAQLLEARARIDRLLARPAPAEPAAGADPGEFAVEMIGAVPVPLAVLDARGTVLLVNRAWSRAVEMNALLAAAPGDDYLRVCGRAAGTQEGEAAAAGIGAVLAGTAGEFELEYPCNAGAETRWFRVRATPFHAAGRTFVMVSQENVTPQRRATREAEAARHQVAGVLETVTDAFFTLDDEWRFTFLNLQSERLLERTRAELLGQRIWDAFPESMGTLFYEEYLRVARDRVPRTFEEYYAPLDRWFEARAFPTVEGISVYYLDVTERRAREKETAELLARLANERSLLKAVLQQLPVGVVIGEAPSGRLLLGNDQMDWIFGHGFHASASVEEYAEWEGFHLDGRRVKADEWPLARALEKGESVRNEEYRIVRGDGTPGIARLSAAPVHDEAGNTIAGVVIAADVTAEAEVTRTLRAQEERHRLIGLATNDVIWEWDLSRSSLEWNDAVETVFGYARRDAGDLDWWCERIHPDEREGVVDSLTQMLSGDEGVWGAEYRFLRADRSYVRVLDRAYVQRGPGGDPVRMIGSMVDLSATERAKEAVRFQALLLDAVEQAVVATDLDGRVISLNRHAESLYGWTSAEVAGGLFQSLIAGPDERARVDEIVARVLGGESWCGELPGRRRDGARFIAQVMCSPIRNARGEVVGLVAVSTDTTERRELEEKLRQSQKMEAVGQLAGGVAHDFNNLLTVIKGTVELIRMDLPASQPIRADIEQIGDAAERAARLTRHLLAFSRKQVLQPQPLDLGALVAGLLPMLSRLIGEDIQLDFRGEGAVRQVEADPGQLEQVLLNLVLNARDAMPQGGRISVATRDAQLTAARGAADGARIPPGRYVEMALSDTGAGIPAEALDHIFEPFYTTKEPGKGTGLGLSTVYGIVAQSGGYVTVRSEVGRGTTFTILLPAAQGGSAAPPAEEPGGLPRGSGTVLIVEDEEGVRKLMARILSRAGYTVLEALDGEAALEVARRERASIDVVVTDLVMPRLSGQAAAGQLRDLLPGVPVIFVTGYTDDEIIRRGVRAADLRLLQKPFTAEELLAEVAEAVVSSA